MECKCKQQMTEIITDMDCGTGTYWCENCGRILDIGYGDPQEKDWNEPKKLAEKEKEIERLKEKKKGVTAWVRKAIIEYKKGKTVVLVFPLDKWILMLIKTLEIGSIRNLGDVKWLAIEDRKPGKGTGRHIAMFVLEAKNE